MDDAEDFYRTLYPRLLGITVHKYSVPEEDAEDLVQAAMLAYLENRDAVRDAAKYIEGALYYGFCTYLRRKLRVTLVPIDEALIPILHPPPHAEQLTVRALLRKFSRRDQHILYLRFGLGLKVREIAAVSHSRAEKLLRAALERAKAELEPHRGWEGRGPFRTVTYVSLEYHPPTRCLDRRWTNSNRSSRRSASRSTIRWRRGSTSISRTSFIRRASS